MAMFKEREQDSRKRAFYAALARAKGEFGPIIKTRVVDYEHREREGREPGGRTKYKYEELADISAIVDPILSKHGLSYRHRTVQGQGGKMTVTCVLSHEDGYSEENSLEGLEDKSGQKNPNQAIASTVTYLQRYTLKEALGIGAGRDDDAGGFDDPMITPDDVVYIEQLIGETGSDLERLLRTVGADSVVDMHASQFKQASWLLETVKRRERKKAEASEAADGPAQP
jgi:ERF superfamily